jgi:hypothetical protein
MPESQLPSTREEVSTDGDVERPSVGSSRESDEPAAPDRVITPTTTARKELVADGHDEHSTPPDDGETSATPGDTVLFSPAGDAHDTPEEPNEERPHVISTPSIIGAGKTSRAEQLARELVDTAPLVIFIDVGARDMSAASVPQAYMLRAIHTALQDRASGGDEESTAGPDETSRTTGGVEADSASTSDDGEPGDYDPLTAMHNAARAAYGPPEVWSMDDDQGPTDGEDLTGDSQSYTGYGPELEERILADYVNLRQRIEEGQAALRAGQAHSLRSYPPRATTAPETGQRAQQRSFAEDERIAGAGQADAAAIAREVDPISPNSWDSAAYQFFDNNDPRVRANFTSGFGPFGDAHILPPEDAEKDDEEPATDSTDYQQVRRPLDTT